ncbi:ABC transporter [Sphingomonas solaris]|uniref:ABC transporter n=2 Tax=Alterirhizorhabdus solaris TaxID=2529389 RepID=A0A558R1Z0_9SPHN|nr:ABC transporter [Sphingomonas solaris]
MRELHTRYGRENVGYLWVIGEPLTLASAIALIHIGESSHYAGDMRPVPFAVLGYCVFIMFRSTFSRAEGALEANMPLMYHRMVTIFDIMISRALLEAAGTFLCLVILMGFLISIDYADPPERPLWMIAAIGYMFWFSAGMSFIIVAITHDNRLLGRLVHPVAYIMMPISGAFYLLEWIPMPYREWLLWIPFIHIFEMVRYGFFRSANPDYFSVTYLTAVCMVTTYIGLVLMKLLRGRLHLH